jgi:hypothetical protein
VDDSGNQRYDLVMRPRIGPALLSSLALLALACSSSSAQSTGADADTGELDGSGPASGVFNGEGITFNRDGVAVYVGAENRTTIEAQLQAADAGGNMKMTIFVPGNMPGQYSCSQNSTGSVVVGITVGESSATYSTSVSVTPCTITIDQYGAVGGSVAGTFSGTLAATMRVGNPPPPAAMTITDGRFDVTRQPDQ